MTATKSLSILQNNNVSEKELINVLKNTLYPGASDESVMMLIAYCKVKKLNPILKPVHIMNMKVKTNKKDSNGNFIYESRDVIMPGIGQYRIDAARSGQYAGMSEPEFGEEVTENLSGKQITYPKWCRVTVKKKLGDTIAEFTAKEFWKENYATAGKDTRAPNEVWTKRAYGQLAKCAEAQALRKAFPDEVGNEYTKEEMEGKIIFEPKTRVIEGEKVEPKNEPIQDRDIQKDLVNISWCETMDDLFNVSNDAYKYWLAAKNAENMKLVKDAKDKRKSEIEYQSKVDPETGEVKDE